MPVMPYHLETGPTFSVLEDFVNADASRLIVALNNLRAGMDLCEIGGLDSITLDPGPYTLAQRKYHLMHDWCGYDENPSGGWLKQPPFKSTQPQTTGYWEGWYGDAEAIMRETLTRAAEVSLGLRHNEPVHAGTVPRRHWPIQFLWKCAQPWFEGWVTWRSDAASSTGHVTVVWATPANGDKVLTSPLAPPAHNGPDYSHTPMSSATRQGQWVITHTKQIPHHASSTKPTKSGKWNFPSFGPIYHGTGPVVVVSPSEQDGGVLGAGRPYVK